MQWGWVGGGGGLGSVLLKINIKKPNQSIIPAKK